MDIAKIRKKLKESGQEDTAKPGAEPEAAPHREEGHEPPAPPLPEEARREEEAARQFKRKSIVKIPFWNCSPSRWGMKNMPSGLMKYTRSYGPRK